MIAVSNGVSAKWTSIRSGWRWDIPVQRILHSIEHTWVKLGRSELHTEPVGPLNSWICLWRPNDGSEISSSGRSPPKRGDFPTF